MQPLVCLCTCLQCVLVSCDYVCTQCKTSSVARTNWHARPHTVLPPMLWRLQCCHLAAHRDLRSRRLWHDSRRTCLFVCQTTNRCLFWQMPAKGKDKTSSTSSLSSTTSSSSSPPQQGCLAYQRLPGNERQLVPQREWKLIAMSQWGGRWTLLTSNCWLSLD